MERRAPIEYRGKYVDTRRAKRVSMKRDCNMSTMYRVENAERSWRQDSRPAEPEVEVAIYALGEYRVFPLARLSGRRVFRSNLSSGREPFSKRSSEHSMYACANTGSLVMSGVPRGITSLRKNGHSVHGHIRSLHAGQPMCLMNN